VAHKNRIILIKIVWITTFFRICCTKCLLSSI